MRYKVLINKVFKMKTILTRRAKEWDNFLQSIIDKREENGNGIKLKKPELERIILHHLGNPKLKEDMINIIITKREEAWMRA